MFFISFNAKFNWFCLMCNGEIVANFFWRSSRRSSVLLLLLLEFLNLVIRSNGEGDEGVQVCWEIQRKKSFLNGK